MIPRLLLAALLLTGCGGLSAPEPEGPLIGAALVEALREGGLVLYLRHTATVEDAPDGQVTDPCEKQRGLTDVGRADARAIGEAIRELGIRTDPVLASPYCRTTETAELAFTDVRRSEALLPVAMGATGEREAKDSLRELLADEPEGSANRVLVGHVSNLRLAADVSPEEGGTVVFRPDGEGFQVVAEVTPETWQRLAERYGATGS